MATQGGFVEWIREIMGTTTAQLPDNSPYIGYAYEASIQLVNLQIAQVTGISPPNPKWTLYDLAVYNLGGDFLVQWASDPTGAPVFMDGLPYWAYLRKAWGVNNFVAGVVNSASDQGTSETMLVPDFFKGLTFSDLQNLKTPYGRMYLSIAQRVGSLWGVT